MLWEMGRGEGILPVLTEGKKTTSYRQGLPESSDKDVAWVDAELAGVL